MCNELLAGYRRHREQLMARKPRGRPIIQDDIFRTILYGIQMLIAYLLMLVAMLYESVLFVALLIGLMTGHFVALRFSYCAAVNGNATEPLWEEAKIYGPDQAFLNSSASGRTPCCGGS